MYLTKLKEHTGVIVGLFLPEQVAQQLHQLVLAAGTPGAEPPADYHITLAYLGDAAALDGRQGALQGMLEEWAAQQGPIVGTISGLGRFNNDEGDGTNPLYASFDAPMLPKLREALLVALGSVGVEVANNHGFTPHITLAYVPADGPLPALVVPPIEMVFPELTLAWGDERTQVQLMPAVEIGEKAANYGALAGENITDLLKRGGDGKFTSAGASAIEAESKRILEQERQRAAQPKSSSRRGASRRSRTGRRAAAPRPSKAEQQQANRAKVLTALGDKMTSAEYAALLAFNAGKPADQDQLGELLRTGLVERDPSGALRMTEAGRAFVAAADRGDSRDALDALSRGQERVLDQANGDIERRQREERREPSQPRAPTGTTSRTSAPRSSGGRGGGGSAPRPPEFSTELAAAAAKLSAGQRLRAAERRALIANGLARRDGRRLVLTAAGLRAAREVAQKDYLRGALMLYKDARGVPRWLSATTTAFEDRDTEILALAALAKDVERSYRTGQHGPLRFWHLGEPNPQSRTAPWGPGIDIGDCDWRCIAGKTLFESGTFRRPEYAELVKAGDQVSPGFFYPFGQPRQMAIAVAFTGKERMPGVFDDVFIFERSIVPAGRASNPLTRIATKEVHMIPEHKKQEYLQRGGDPALLEQLVLEQGTAEKEAQQRGVAFKEAGDAATTEAAEPEAMVEPAGTDEAAQAPAAEEPLLVGDLTPDEFVALQVKANEPLMAQLGSLSEQLGGLGLTEKVRGLMDEFKTTFTAQKDAERAETAEQLAALKQAGEAGAQAGAALRVKIGELETQLKEARTQLDTLLGEQPAGPRGYRASADPSTDPAQLSNGARLKEGQPQPDPLGPHVQGAMSAINAATGAQPPRG